MTGWAYLGAAIVLEVAATVLLKLSDGLVRWQLALASIGFYALCFLFLAPALKTIPLGVAYAIWSGAGIIAMAILGTMVFGQSLNPAQMGFIALLLVGAIGLRVTTSL